MQSFNRKTGVEHLEPAIWQKVNRDQIKKAISEFSHEWILQPILQESYQNGWSHYRLNTEQPDVYYLFKAKKFALDHWSIETDSLCKFQLGKPTELNALLFFIELKKTLNIPEALFELYLEEISSTLYGRAYKHLHERFNANELLNADFQDVETSMSEGHPAFVANNGRIGFDTIDYTHYAPEANHSFSIVWLAVDKTQATFACTTDLSYERFIQDELEQPLLSQFLSVLDKLNVNSDDYFFIPAHPWQWKNKLSIIFSSDIAQRKIIYLGESHDFYLAQQSVRTLFNISSPHKYYVKMALSVLNMGFMRGLSPYYMSATPAINEYIDTLLKKDPYIQSTRFSILRECASIGYKNKYALSSENGISPYDKMLSALWRDNPMNQLSKGQQLRTMASLLHVDTTGSAFLACMIKASGIGFTSWIKQYLRCYLTPLLHCFYAYELVFMPHGENLILVFEHNIPVRAIMKDIAEEAFIINLNAAVPENIERMKTHVSEDVKTLSIFTDIFDGFFRYMAEILVLNQLCTEENFWHEVGQCILDYQNDNPQLRKQFERYDLFAPEFKRSCLNRLQLANNKQMVDLTNVEGSLSFVGVLENPIGAPLETINSLVKKSQDIKTCG